MPLRLYSYCFLCLEGLPSFFQINSISWKLSSAFFFRECYLISPGQTRCFFCVLLGDLNLIPTFSFSITSTKLKTPWRKGVYLIYDCLGTWVFSEEVVQKCLYKCTVANIEIQNWFWKEISRSASSRPSLYTWRNWGPEQFTTLPDVCYQHWNLQFALLCLGISFPPWDPQTQEHLAHKSKGKFIYWRNKNWHCKRGVFIPVQISKNE